ncbi:MAG: thioredoxin domain-containing protein, partial [Candidatus Bathyarchaeia archaeon]
MSMRNRKASTHPIILTDGNFDMKVGENALILVDFWADWCMPCQMMAPVFEHLAEKYAGRIAFAKLNVDENVETARR